MRSEKIRKYYREYARGHRMRNPEKHKAYHKKYREENKDKRKNGMLKFKFNLTLDEYNIMLKNQDGICKICSMPETARKNNSDEVRMLSVDHDHNTGQIRGLLCNKCNRALGHYEATKPRAQDFEKYLQEAIKL